MFILIGLHAYLVDKEIEKEKNEHDIDDNEESKEK